MKKIISTILTIGLLLNIQTWVFAYELPSSFWSANTQYEQALTANNHSNIIKYGTQIIDIVKNLPDFDNKQNIMISRYDAVGSSYAQLDDYDNSARTYQQLYDYIKPFTSRPGDVYYDNYVMAPEKIKQYTSQIAMYTDKGGSTYYNAKNEKENGVLFGTCVTAPTRSMLDNESMVLIYQEINQSLLPYNTEEIRKASEEGYAVEFALNCPNEAYDIRNIRNLESNLSAISDVFRKYSNVPVYLRFAAEFDIWNSMATPAEFIDAFRYVSNYFKTRNNNVAIVWSPNKVSGWNVNIDDFYPGDQYVDWVGMSFYAQRYFLGSPNQSENNEIAFMSGINSDPVIMAKEIVEKYGDRKPIMLSESGCNHTMMNTGENVTDFALRRLQEMYAYLPMVYPQIKLIAYFDQYINGETDDYRLSSNKTLQNEYLRLVEGQRFIQDKYSNSTSYCYRKVGNGTTLDGVFEVSCYAHSYATETKSVTYYIDDKYVGMATEIPFTTYIDASTYAGRHTLKAVAQFKNGKTLATESTVNINSANTGINVEISGKRIQFDQNPIIYNDRTMVPMRKIFEELGASVSWDQSTRTATGTKGNTVVKISVGKNKMYVNGKSIFLDTAPVILSDRTLVPVRAVAEGLGCKVDWDGSRNLVIITP